MTKIRTVTLNIIGTIALAIVSIAVVSIVIAGSLALSATQ